MFGVPDSCVFNCPFHGCILHQFCVYVICLLLYWFNLVDWLLSRRFSCIFIFILSWSSTACICIATYLLRCLHMVYSMQRKVKVNNCILLSTMFACFLCNLKINHYYLRMGRSVRQKNGEHITCTQLDSWPYKHSRTCRKYKSLYITWDSSETQRTAEKKFEKETRGPWVLMICLVTCQIGS